jgi:hypothetical protein
MTSAELKRKSWVPRLGALITALVGLVNIASALTPNIRWRGHLLLQFEAEALTCTGRQAGVACRLGT